MEDYWRPWGFLRVELLEQIVNRLESRTDILIARAVCSFWRSSIPLPPKTLSNPDGSPLKLPFPVCPNKHLHSRQGFFSLKESTIYCIEPSIKISSSCCSTTTKTWTCRVDFAKSGKLRLKDLLSVIPIDNLGKIGTLPDKVVNLLDFRVREVGKAYALDFSDTTSLFDFMRGNVQFVEMKSILVRKAAVGFKNRNEFWVMAIQAEGKLGVWKKGDTKWANFNDGYLDSCYQDVAFHNGRFFAVDFRGMTVAIDPSSLNVTQVTPAMLPGGESGSFFTSRGHEYGVLQKYLVDSLGTLFLIDKFMDVIEDCGKTPYLQVYKLNEEKGEWIRVKDLADRVMFVGDHFSFSVSARDSAGLRKNCIYFNDRCLGRVEDDELPSWAGLFDLEDDVSRPLESIVGYSNVFWPPPSWLG